MLTLSIIVPCYYEEEVLAETTRRLTSLLEQLIAEGLIHNDSYILYVNDGSNDQTWPIIQRLHETQEHVCGVNLAANVGHQNALMAGLTAAYEAGADLMVSIDADLQDDEKAIRDMVLKYNAGADIVYGVRSSRESDTWFKRFTAQSFYRVMQKMGVKSVYNHADYRLMSRRAVAFLLQFRERNLFLRGIVPLIGYKTDCVYYARTERMAGESKYPLSKMIAFACDGITSFSFRPVHYVIYTGFVFILIAFCIGIWALYELIQGRTVQGWTSLILSIWFVGGVLMLSMGIVGVYIGKIYIEVKDRPRFNIEKKVF